MKNMSLTNEPTQTPESLRLKQLEASLRSEDVATLQRNRTTVEAFLQLGNKWEFFELDEAMTQAAQRDVLKNAFMPEALLALLLEQRVEDLSALETEIDEALKDNPRALAEKLLEQARAVLPKTSEGLIEDIAEEVASASEDFLSLLALSSFGEEAPEWMMVIKTNELSPNDLKSFYQAVENQQWAGAKAEPVVSEIANVGDDTTTVLNS